MIRIAIVDDDKRYLNKINDMVKEYMKSMAAIDCYLSSQELIDSIKNKGFYDILILDIDLGEDKLGTDIGKRIKQLDPDVLLIYVSHHLYFTDISHAEPFDFISKSNLNSDLNYVLKSALARLRLTQSSKVNYFVYKKRGGRHRILLDDVVWFESDKRNICIHYIKEKIEQFPGKLDSVEIQIQRLCSNFARLNKSILVNGKYIASSWPYRVEMRTGQIFNITEIYALQAWEVIDNIFGRSRK